jgi:hypothetical protein
MGWEREVLCQGCNEERVSSRGDLCPECGGKERANHQQLTELLDRQGVPGDIEGKPSPMARLKWLIEDRKRRGSQLLTVAAERDALQTERQVLTETIAGYHRDLIQERNQSRRLSEECLGRKQERDALRAEVERLRGVIVTAENALMNDHPEQAARVLAAEVEGEGEQTNG